MLTVVCGGGGHVHIQHSTRMQGVMLMLRCSGRDCEGQHGFRSGVIGEDGDGELDFHSISFLHFIILTLFIVTLCSLPIAHLCQDITASWWQRIRQMRIQY